MTGLVDKLRDPYAWTPAMVRIYRGLYRIAQKLQWLRRLWMSLRHWRYLFREYSPFVIADIKEGRGKELILDALFDWLLEYRSRRRNNANNP